MGIFGAPRHMPPPHPRQEPRYDIPLTAADISRVFEGCADFSRRTAHLGGDPARPVELLYIAGQVRSERACDYILRPLAQSRALRETPDFAAAFAAMAGGALYSLNVQVRTTADQVLFDMVDGWVALFVPGQARALTLSAATEEKRSVSDPENEPDVKGARDSFVESLRTNTSLVRRRLRTPELRIDEQLVGRQSVTPVDVVYIRGIADEALAGRIRARLGEMDIDALLTTGSLEPYLTGQLGTAFPLIAYTERPDRFCAGLTEGRVGVLADGLPVGWLAPGTVDQFFRTGQDRSQNWMAACALAVLRYLCVLVTLLLPGLYAAAVLFHPELIPRRLAQSIIAARQSVPVPTLLEILLMLLSFEVLQEAGLRLPSSIGQTVSILGGLVVGTAAVDAKLVSPAVLVVVAVAGIAGYTAPSQDFAAALRLWRFGITAMAGVLGLVGLVLGCILLIFHLARLESFGVAYLTPFASNAGEQAQGHAVLRRPAPLTKLWEKYLHTKNRRNQA